MLKTTEKKMSKLCKEEKVTWDNLDQETDTLQRQIDNIDKLANEKVGCFAKHNSHDLIDFCRFADRCICWILLPQNE